MSDELREKVARAIAITECGQEYRWGEFTVSATHAIALVRAETLEEAAKVCDERERANLYGVKECAAAIRALKEKA